MEESFKWYKLAAEDPRNYAALNSVADFYYLGKGTEVNYELAFEYYEKAAEIIHIGRPVSSFICTKLAKVLTKISTRPMSGVEK